MNHLNFSKIVYGGRNLKGCSRTIFLFKILRHTEVYKNVPACWSFVFFYRAFWNKMHSTDHSWHAALRSSLFLTSLLGIFHLLLKYSMCHFIIFTRYFWKSDTDEEIIEESSILFLVISSILIWKYISSVFNYIFNNCHAKWGAEKK